MKQRAIQDKIRDHTKKLNGRKRLLLREKKNKRRERQKIKAQMRRKRKLEKRREKNKKKVKKTQKPHNRSIGRVSESKPKPPVVKVPKMIKVMKEDIHVNVSKAGFLKKLKKEHPDTKFGGFYDMGDVSVNLWKLFKAFKSVRVILLGVICSTLSGNNINTLSQ